MGLGKRVGMLSHQSVWTSRLFSLSIRVWRSCEVAARRGVSRLRGKRFRGLLLGSSFQQFVSLPTRRQAVAPRRHQGAAVPGKGDGQTPAQAPLIGWCKTHVGSRLGGASSARSLIRPERRAGEERWNGVAKLCPKKPPQGIPPTFIPRMAVELFSDYLAVWAEQNLQRILIGLPRAHLPQLPPGRGVE